MRHNWNFAGTAYKDLSGATQTVCNPAWPTEVVGKVCQASPTDLPPAIAGALAAAGPWAALQVRDRAQILVRAADLYERHAGELIALAAREAGKTLADGVAEVREAVDFLRYYASEAAQSGFSQPRGSLPVYRLGIFRWPFSPGRSALHWSWATVLLLNQRNRRR